LHQPSRHHLALPHHHPAVDLLISERQVVTREVRGGYYQPTAYLLSKLTLDAGEEALGLVVLCAVPWLGLQPGWRMSSVMACCQNGCWHYPCCGWQLLLRPGSCGPPWPTSALLPAPQCCCGCCRPSGTSSPSTTWPASVLVRAAAGGICQLASGHAQDALQRVHVGGGASHLLCLTLLQPPCSHATRRLRLRRRLLLHPHHLLLRGGRHVHVHHK
jgi:hypothetical protein